MEKKKTNWWKIALIVLFLPIVALYYIVRKILNPESRRQGFILLAVYAVVIMPFLVCPAFLPDDNETPVRLSNSQIMETAIALNIQTLSAQTPTLESLPTEVLIETSLPIPTNTLQSIATSTEASIVPVSGSNTDCIPNNQPQTGRVVDIVDGNTARILMDHDGKTYTLRYIGIDTPENANQVEYFGPEATAKNAELVYGKTVTLFKDVSETDQNNRLLRYVVVDNIFVNYELVAQGYANTVSYPPDTACILTFQAAEQVASSSTLGLWGAPPTPLPVPTLALLPTQPVTGGSSGSSSGVCCKYCGPNSKACGDSCISLSYTCHKPPGCACNK